MLKKITKKRYVDPSMKIGSLVNGVISKITQKGIVVRIKPGNSYGYINQDDIFDEITTSHPTSHFKNGQEIIALVKSKTSRKTNLTIKKSLIAKEIELKQNSFNNIEIKKKENKDDKEMNIRVEIWGDYKKDEKLIRNVDNNEIECNDMQNAKELIKSGLKEEKSKDEENKELELYLKNNEFKVSGDYEKAIEKFPNESKIWIKYISFYIECGEIICAREASERALKTIEATNEYEKLKIWTNYIKNEVVNGFGLEYSIKLFKRALQFTDQKKLCLKLITILMAEKIQTELLKNVVNSMERKFTTSAKVALKAIEFWLYQRNSVMAKETLTKYLKTLPKRKHLKVLSSAAILEYKMGNMERGRDIFEGIILTYPKNINYWNMYIDQEIKNKDEKRIRILFERFIKLKIKANKMKSIFKKYLAYEEMYGTEEKVNEIKEKALAYVESNI